MRCEGNVFLVPAESVFSKPPRKLGPLSQLTHITLLGEPMDEPGGEMEASDSRRCCRRVKEMKNVRRKEESVRIRFLQS